MLGEAPRVGGEPSAHDPNSSPLGCCSSEALGGRGRRGQGDYPRQPSLQLV